MSQELDQRTEVDRDGVLASYKSHVNRGLALLAELSGTGVEVRSEGVFVFDEDGAAYLDCGGYGVFILGHRHPRVVEAVRRQLDTHPLSTRLLLSPELAEGSRVLAGASPAGLEYVFFTNSGAEAVEAALKLCRANGRRRVVATTGGFHGKTIGALSVSGRPQFREPFEPLLPDVERVPFGDAAAIEEALGRGGAETCVILEPVQGEGGVIVPPDGYLRAVRASCDRHGALLVFDEIQSGMGRTGTWWACDREGVSPDVLCVGKGLSGGVIPVGAAVATPEVFEPLNRDPLLHTSTFGGNPLATVAAKAAIEAIRDEGLVQQAASTGREMLRRLRDELLTPERWPVVDVRGAGLMIGIEFAEDYLAGDFTIELLGRRVVVSYCLNSHNVVRLTPPAAIAPAEREWLYAASRDVVAVLRERYG